MPISWKRGFRGPKTPHLPLRPEKEFSVKKPQGKSLNGDFLTENSLLRPEGKWGFLDPETLFSRKWAFGLLSGVGESQRKCL